MDRDGTKLARLAKALNNEENRSATISVNKDDNIVTGREAANCFIDDYEQLSHLQIPDDRKKEVPEEMKNMEENQDTPYYMNTNFSMKELEQATETLKDKKSHGPDKITNEMLKHLGKKAKAVLLKIFNNSWKRDVCPNHGEKPT